VSGTEGEGPPAGTNYRSVNAQGWDLLSLADDPAPFDLSTARQRLDDAGWLPWNDIVTVLCVASGGGEQGPLFAGLGYQVTVVDLSAGQLERDRQVAFEEGLTIECLQADMLDLSPLYGRTFDLVYQAISACYIPDVRRLYREIATVTRPGGHYAVSHWAPSHLQLAADVPWDGTAYRIDRPATATDPLLWRSAANGTGSTATCLHYGHTLGALVGGLCDAGFEITRLREPDVGDANAEPGSESHLAAYFPPFIEILARRAS
jgi:SAM-dependent methyltransferase